MSQKQKITIQEAIQKVSLFVDTFNERPVSHSNKIPRLYYSELLITKQKLEDYENSCALLSKFSEQLQQINDEAEAKR